MHPVLTSCRLFLTVLADLVAGLKLQAGMNRQRPVFASRAIARRLVTAVRLVEAYLRRVLLVMALELEPTLVDAPRPLKRPDGRNRPVRAPGFKVFDGGMSPRDAERLETWAQDRVWRPKPYQARRAPVAMGRLYQRLDQLAMIAADPLSRARRLAFHLARLRPGPILAPNLRLRPPRTWRPETALSFSAMGALILERSKVRPPPLPPPRRYRPSVIALCW